MTRRQQGDADDHVEKEYGEQLTIHKPNFNPSLQFNGEENPFNVRFELIPELPSHVPTPETIDEGIEGFQRQLQIIFTEDEEVTTPTRKRSGLSQTPQQHSPRSPSSPTKWGPEVWQSSKMRPSFARPLHIPKRPLSPSDPISELHDASDEFLSSNSKLILSEDVVETVERCSTSSPSRRTMCSALPLQRQWMEENAQNLHFSCNNICQDENDSRRRRFLFRPRAQMMA